MDRAGGGLVRARRGRTNTDWSIRIEVRAGRNYLSADPGYTARRDELLAQAKTLSWRPDARRDETGDRGATTSHDFEVTDVEWPPKVNDETLTGLIAEGLMAYARAFHAYLSTDQ